MHVQILATDAEGLISMGVKVSFAPQEKPLLITSVVFERR